MRYQINDEIARGRAAAVITSRWHSVTRNGRAATRLRQLFLSYVFKCYGSGTNFLHQLFAVALHTLKWKPSTQGITWGAHAVTPVLAKGIPLKQRLVAPDNHAPPKVTHVTGSITSLLL